jgi:hypothetical protein
MAMTLETAVLTTARALLFLSHPVLIRQFVKRLGYLPNPAVPRTYNEKVLWRKLLDHDRRFVAFADKLAAKEYARARCPDLPIPRTLWIGDTADAIPDATTLSGDDVVVKTNHGFNFNVFISNGNYNRAALVRTVARWLRTVHGQREGEWAYGLIRPRVFVEERLALDAGDAPTDIKVHACDGEIVHGWAVNKNSEKAVTLAPSGDSIGRALTYASDERALPVDDALRARFAEASRFARTLSQGVDYARYDFLVARGRLYFGEITLYPAAGYDGWADPAVALRLARCWDLRKSAFLMADRSGPLGVYARALRARLGRVSV